MKTHPILPATLLAALALLLANCAQQIQPKIGPDGKPINPHSPGTLEHFQAESNYPATHDVWTDHELLKTTNAGNSHLRFNLATQRGFLMREGKVVIDYPICTGTRSRPTPTGTFKILEKVVDKSSNRYGKIYDAEGNVINYDADAFQDEIPEGGKFVGAPMRYWMRLTPDGVGHHIGPVRRRPSSHGCLRGPSGTIPTVFSKVGIGTEALIVSGREAEAEELVSLP